MGRGRQDSGYCQKAVVLRLPIRADCVPCGRGVHRQEQPQSGLQKTRRDFGAYGLQQGLYATALYRFRPHYTEKSYEYFTAHH